MGFLESVFKKVTSSDNRKAPRLDSPPLVAYYFDGGTPTAHEIQNISSDGFYLVTQDRLRPGTVITMTLQMPSDAMDDSTSRPHLTVNSIVVRQDAEGVGFAFIPNETKDSNQSHNSASRPASRKAITRFLEEIKSDAGHMMISFRAGISKQTALPQNEAKTQGTITKRLVDESGQALVITALCMTCLLGFVAIAADVGIMLREKRLAQIAADGAAIAGAADLSYGNATTSARAAAAQNGFTNGSGGATVTVNAPPSFGAYATQQGYVEVIISQAQPTLFMGLFGRSSMTVAARAVAANGPGTGCIYALSSSGPAITGSGGASLSDPSCGVIVDSSSNNGLSLSGGASISVKSIGIVGSADSVSGGASVTPAPVFDITPVSDPLVYLQASAPSYNTSSLSCAAAANVSGGHTLNLAPSGPVACYNGISASGGSTLNITNPGVIVINGSLGLSGGSTANFGAGLYYITGQFAASGGNTASGTGVTFYAASPGGSFNLSGGVNLNLTAPTSGTYNGLLFWQAQGNTQPITLSGGASSTLKGVIYAPSASLSMSGGAGSNLYTDLVVSSMALSGGANLLSYAAVNANSPIHAVRLVE